MERLPLHTKEVAKALGEDRPIIMDNLTPTLAQEILAQNVECLVANFIHHNPAIRPEEIEICHQPDMDGYMKIWIRRRKL